jgi:hypothetical protein
MPNNFEVGDVVLCIEGSSLGTLVNGDTYRIIGSDQGQFVNVSDAENKDSHGWYYRRFVLTGEPKTPKLTGMTQFYKDREISYG